MRLRADSIKYSCFVEGCERKCLTHQKRRMHMIDKHMYPKNFFFAVTKQGIDGRRSLLVENAHHRRRSSTGTQSRDARRRSSVQDGTDSGSPKTLQLLDSPQLPSRPAKMGAEKDQDEDEDEDVANDTEMAELTGAMSALQFVPRSVRFGRGRAGFAKR